MYLAHIRWGSGGSERVKVKPREQRPAEYGYGCIPRGVKQTGNPFITRLPLREWLKCRDNSNLKRRNKMVILVNNEDMINAAKEHS